MSNIITFTGLNMKETIQNKFRLKEKRYITYNTILLNSSNEIYTYKLRAVYYILNKKVKLINNMYRNYKLRNNNKLNNSYKRLYFHKKFNDKCICNDIIYKIFNSLKILKK